MLKLIISKNIQAESFHYYDSYSKDYIYSIGNKVFVSINKIKYEIKLPIKKRYFFLEKNRIFRRLLRLNMMNIVLNNSKNGLIILYFGAIYFFNFNTKTLTKTYEIEKCRNVPYNSIAVTKKGIYFGEYRSNKNRDDIKIWCSRDDGLSWSQIYKLPGIKTRHIHGIYFDKFTKSLWICTGDLNGECYLYNTNEDFSNIRQFGDGSQKWRPLSLIFEEKYIIWGMDSNLEISKLVIFDRETHNINLGKEFPGPIWYSKQLDEGISLISSAVEIGEGVITKYAYIFYSKNNRDWFPLAKYKKDYLPMPYFKYGIISFADGNQNKDDFIIFGEGLIGLDGKSYRGKLMKKII